MSLKIYCDGGARGNPGPAASAFVVQDDSGKEIFAKGFHIGHATNNQAEYYAVIKALEWLSSSGLGDREITFFLDSLLVASQLKGVYKVKDAHLREYNFQIKNLIAKYHLKILDYLYIPRELNSRADVVVNRTLDNL